MDAFDWSQLSPTYWFADTTEPVDHPIYLVLAVIMTLCLFGAMYVRLRADRMMGGHRFRQRQAVRLANYAITLAAVGLIVLLFRWQPAPLLSKPIWLYLWMAAFVSLIVYAFLYYRRRYPRELQTYEATVRRRRYLPHGGAPIGGRPRRRSGRRR